VIQNIIMLYITDIIEDACCFPVLHSFYHPIRYNLYCMFQLADIPQILYNHCLCASLYYNKVRKNTHFLCGFKCSKVYKPTHGSNLFNTSETFVDGQVVSTSYGYATAKTDNSIDFHINCAWHIIDEEYNNVSKDLKRVGDVLYGTFTHPGFFGGDALTFHEKYVQE